MLDGIDTPHKPNPELVAAWRARKPPHLEIREAETMATGDSNSSYPANWKTPMTDGEVAEVRVWHAEGYELQYGPLPKGGYTCDGCGVRRFCTDAFDMYNTNGDCLAEK